MYKPPSEDEIPLEEEPDRKATRKPPRVRPRQSVVPRQVPEKTHKEFYSDEHPEVPKIRRASLNKPQAAAFAGVDVEEDQATAPRTRRVRKDTPPLTGYDERAKSSETSPYTRLIRQQGHREMLPFTGIEEDEVDEENATRTSRSTRKIPQVTGRQRAVGAEASVGQTRTRVAPHATRRSSRAYQTFWKRRQNFLLVVLLALAVLVIAPLLITTVHNAQPTPQATSNSGSNNQGISVSRLQGVPSNPHELVIRPPNNTHPAPPVMATSAYLLDASSEATYYAQNPFLHLPMLSTTKLMTATLAVEDGNLDQNITITAAMEHDISKLSADSAIFGVKQGETYTLRDLLYGLLFVSGNDAALIIADALAGSVQNFVAQMNQKAQVLGLADTHFVNPHGLLDAGQYSCARDLAVLGLFSLSIPALQTISGQKVYHIAAGGKHGARVLLNENQLLWWYPGVKAGKTGYDGGTDFIQVMMVTRNQRTMVGVVMHSSDWWTDMRNLMDYGANDYTWVSPRDVDASGQPIPYDNLWNYFTKDTQQITIPTAGGGQYYAYTGYSVSGPILTYFNQQGGLTKFGYPSKIPVPLGGSVLGQQFQRGTIQCDFSSKQCRAV